MALTSLWLVGSFNSFKPHSGLLCHIFLFLLFITGVTIDEICEMLRIGKNKAYKFLQRGGISSIKDGGLWIIPKKAVIDYISNLGR